MSSVSDVGRYIEAICKDLSASFGQCDIHVEAQAGIYNFHRSRDINRTDRQRTRFERRKARVSRQGRGRGMGQNFHDGRRQLSYRHS